MMQIRLRDVPVGELVLWRNKIVGDVYAEVLNQNDIVWTTVMADNNFEYRWDKSMIVEVDEETFEKLNSPKL